MKKNSKSKHWLIAALFGCALAGTAGSCLGAEALTNDFTSNVDGWGVGFGTGTVEWNATGGPDGSGCLMFVLDASNPENKEVAPQVDFATAFGTTIKSSDYLSIEYDLLIDPASGQDENLTYGNWQEVLRDASWGWDNHWVGALTPDYTAWTHMKFAMPNNGKTYPYLTLALQGTTNYSGSVPVAQANFMRDMR